MSQVIQSKYIKRVQVDVPENKFAWPRVVHLNAINLDNNSQQATLDIPVAAAPVRIEDVHPKVPDVQGTNTLYLASNEITFTLTFKTNIKWKLYLSSEGSTNSIHLVSGPSEGVPSNPDDIITCEIKVDARGIAEFEGNNKYKSWRYFTIKIEDINTGTLHMLAQLYQAPICRVGFFDYRNPFETTNPDYPYLPNDITVDSNGIPLYSWDAPPSLINYEYFRQIVSTTGPYVLSTEGAPSGADFYVQEPFNRVDGDLHKGKPTSSEELDQFSSVSTIAPKNIGNPRSWKLHVSPLLYKYNSIPPEEYKGVIPVQDTLREQSLTFQPLTIVINQDAIPTIGLTYNGGTLISNTGEALSGILNVSFSRGSSSYYQWEWTAEGFEEYIEVNGTKQWVPCWLHTDERDNPQRQFRYGWCRFAELEAIGDKVINFQVDSNTTGINRSSWYKVRLKDYPDIEASVSVTQTAQDSLQVNWNVPINTIPSTGGSITITISASGISPKYVTFESLMTANSDYSNLVTNSGVTFSSGTTLQIPDGYGTFNVIATFPVNNIYKNKYFRINAKKYINASGGYVSEIGTPTYPCMQSVAPMSFQFMPEFTKGKSELVLGNNSLTLPVRFKSNFDCTVQTTISGASTNNPTIYINDSNYNTVWEWNITVAENTSTSTNTGKIFGWRLGDPDYTLHNPIDLSQNGKSGKVGYWEEMYAISRRPEDGGITTDDRVQPPYSNKTLSTMPEYSNTGVTNAVPALPNPHTQDNANEAVGVISFANKWATYFDNSSTPSISNGWCSITTEDNRLSIGGGVYDKTEGMLGDTNTNGQEFPTLRVALTANTSYTPRNCTINLFPYGVNLATPDYGTNNNSATGVQIYVPQAASPDPSKIVGYRILAQHTNPSPPPILDIVVYIVDSDGNQAEGSLPTSIYVCIEDSLHQPDNAGWWIESLSESKSFTSTSDVNAIGVYGISFDNTQDTSNWSQELTFNGKYIRIG